MATCVSFNGLRAAAALAALLITRHLLIGDGGRPVIPAAFGQQLQAGMPLGSSWPARNLSYLASPAEAFCFGWLQFPSGSHKFYVAVWYTALDNAIVWVVNRDVPAAVNDSLHLTLDGNLQLISNSNSSDEPIWQTNTASKGSASALKLLDSGNLVLLQKNGSYAWQSFSSPTDTLLPSQSFLITHTLISRPPAYSTSLASGNFKFYTGHDSASIDHINATTGKSITTVWRFSQRIVFPVDAIKSSVITGQFMQSGVFFMYNSSTGDAYSQIVPSDYGNITPPTSNPVYRRLTLDPDGDLRMYGWDYGSGKWVMLCKAISDLCTTMAFRGVPVCGSYGVCVQAPEPACACPPGFHPTDAGDVSRGCRRLDSLMDLPSDSCQNTSQPAGSNITYLMLRNTNFYWNDILARSGIGLQACQDLCTRLCLCMGVIYDHSGSAICWLKGPDLLNGYSPQKEAGTRDAFIKLWNSTTSPVINPPLQSPVLVWINSSAFWSQASTLQPTNLTLTVTCSPPDNGNNTSTPAACSSARYYRRMAILIVSVISGGELLCFVLSLFLLQKTNYFCRHHGQNLASPAMQHAGCRAFTYAELAAATNEFSHPLGAGAFGAVVKGVLPDGTDIAVKRLQTSVLQIADAQFKAEIATLGRIHHMSLVRLHGYCAEGPDHRLLVYEFMENGSLNSFLFEGRGGGDAGAGISRKRLDWNTRYSICLGTAKGLAYLHEDCLDCIVHCDIKPENILLDKEFCPKVADFGLAYLFGRNETLEVSNVRGTRGYLAPEWLSYLPITAKADVFSYGMVLIEIVSGRRNYRFSESAMASGRWKYPSWAFQKVQSGQVEEVVDPSIRGNEAQLVDYAEVEKVLRIAFLCLHQEATARPTMRSIVQMLEGSAQLPSLPHGPGSFQHQVETGREDDDGHPTSEDRQGPHFSTFSGTSTSMNLSAR